MRENNDAKLRKVFDIRQKDNNFTGAVATQRSPFQTGRSNKIDPTSQNVGNEVVGKKESAGAVNSNDARPSRFVSNSSNDPKPLLRLKFKNPYLDNRSSWAREGEEDNFVKGHRSKRKRPSTKKVGSLEDSPAKPHQESPADEVMDANWILRKLGKDAIGKRVEVRLSSDNSWQVLFSSYYFLIFWPFTHRMLYCSSLSYLRLLCLWAENSSYREWNGLT